MNSKKITKPRAENNAALSKQKRKVLSSLEPEEAEMILDTVPKETRMELVEQIETRTLYSGPIPHPELLRQFNEIIPNGADRIMSMAEKQNTHRIEIEKSVVEARNRDSHKGVMFAGLMGVLGVLGSIVLIAIGKDTGGYIVGGGTLASLVGVYLRGTHLDREDLRNKRTSSED